MSLNDQGIFPTKSRANEELVGGGSHQLVFCSFLKIFPSLESLKVTNHPLFRGKEHTKHIFFVKISLCSSFPSTVMPATPSQQDPASSMILAGGSQENEVPVSVLDRWCQ